ncbi:MAG: hypothetical protein JWQ18_2238 [Conexibacter sp.]|nr:hypothetical protein [Conexibacter sp.]
MHERGAVIFAIIETVATVAVVYAFILRGSRAPKDAAPSWLHRDADPASALDRLTLRYGDAAAKR